MLSASRFLFTYSTAMAFFSRPKSLADYQGYLQAIWQAQRLRYELNWRFYNGDIWAQAQKDGSGKASSERQYRLAVNDIVLGCNMHAQMLFGEVRDTVDPLVTTKVAVRGNQRVDETLLKNAQTYLNELYFESDARQQQLTAAVSSQVGGGVFWRVRYGGFTQSPFDLYPFKIEAIHADHVYPVFMEGTTRFNELFVRYWLTKEATEAEYGYWRAEWPDRVIYEEHWSAGAAGKLIIRIGVDEIWHTIKEEDNPFGFIPFVYIPHVVSNRFYGIPLAELAGAIELSEEYNARLGNLGDIIKQNSYPFATLTDHATGIIKQPQRLWRDGPVLIDLGQTGPTGNRPQLTWFDPAELTAGSMAYLNTLKKEVRMSMAIPPVAMGEDEGSQRSSLTLIARMFPMKSHILTERWLWSSALAYLNRMALQMAKIMKVGDLDGLDVARIKVISKWSAMLPRDRAEVVNEYTQRAAVGHVAPEDALEQYEDIAPGDIEEAYHRIQRHLEWEASLNLRKPVVPNEGGDI